MPLTTSPKILRGAFIEYGISLPPLFVVFQFNPEDAGPYARVRGGEHGR